MRYYLLIAVALAGLFSLQVLGLLDPLVIFQRATTALASNFFALQQPPQRIFLSVISLMFLAILLLELWQPRFWCRNLCPLGALISLFSRFSLLNRQVSSVCSFCGDCRRACVMNAIPRKEPHDTDYSDCTFCLECESACPNTGISFAFGTLAGKRWLRNPQISKSANQQTGDAADPSLPLSLSPILPTAKPQFQGSYQPKSGKFGITLTRRELFGGLAAGAAGARVGASGRARSARRGAPTAGRAA